MHLLVTGVFVSCILVSLFYTNGALTTVLLCVLLFIQQYFYYLMMLDPPNVEPFCFCTDCNKMTSASYIHCKKCSKCVPVERKHVEWADKCLSINDLDRYANVVTIMLSTSIFCTILESVVYQPFMLISFLYIFAYKSIITKMYVDI